MSNLRTLLNLLILSLFYIIFTMIAAHFIDALFYNPIQDIKDTGSIKLFIEITSQVICCVLAIYYIRKIAKLIAIHLGEHIKTYLPPVYNGEIIISIIFIATQFNLLRKINYLVNKHNVFIYKKKISNY